MSSELQDIIVKEMKVKTAIKSENEVHKIIHFIKQYVKIHGFIKFLIPFSYTPLQLPAKEIVLYWFCR
ncbi:hypothetical protein [Staphylococcus simulans]